MAEGSNYPGLADLRGRQGRLAEWLAAIYERLFSVGEELRLVLDYKLLEPAVHHTEVSDWSTSYAQVVALGGRVHVCLDPGHHAPGTNIEIYRQPAAPASARGHLTRRARAGPRQGAVPLVRH